MTVPVARDILYVTLLCLLGAVAIIDYRRLIIPDLLTVAIACLSLPYIYLSDRNPAACLAAALLAGSIGWSLRWYFRQRLAVTGLGRGDIKLMAALGLWVGLDRLSVFFMASGLAGLVTALLWRYLGRGRFFPFGPALSAGAGLTLLTI
jgi:prepilin signal peptidase PulO-like enzyme (type II secretory pathway)